MRLQKRERAVYVSLGMFTTLMICQDVEVDVSSVSGYGLFVDQVIEKGQMVIGLSECSDDGV